MFYHCCLSLMPHWLCKVIKGEQFVVKLISICIYLVQYLLLHRDGSLFDTDYFVVCGFFISHYGLSGSESSGWGFAAALPYKIRGVQ